MSRLKKIIIGLIIFIAAFLLFAIWYKYTYSMEVIAPYEINDPAYNKKLLIASQGSAFKNALVDGITNHFKQDSIYIKVIDATSLAEVSVQDWNSIVILHTWEYGKPPKEVTSFINNTEHFKDRIIVVTTSGGGEYKMKNTDAITGASIIKNVPDYIQKVISELNPLLK